MGQINDKRCVHTFDADLLHTINQSHIMGHIMGSCYNVNSRASLSPAMPASQAFASTPRPAKTCMINM